jgi:hypothetical protein
MSEPLTVPRILIGNWQLPPDVRSMSAVEFSPQSASVPEIEHSETAAARDTDSRLGQLAMSANAATFDNCIIGFSVALSVYGHHSSGTPARARRMPSQTRSRPARYFVSSLAWLTSKRLMVKLGSSASPTLAVTSCRESGTQRPRLQDAHRGDRNGMIIGTRRQ